MRKKQKKKELKQNDHAFEIEEVICPMEDLQISSKSEGCMRAPLAEKTADVLETDHSVEATKKKIRTLKKKLKQIEELEEKLHLGELNPNKEQLTKISKKEEFLREIQTLTVSQ